MLLNCVSLLWRVALKFWNSFLLFYYSYKKHSSVEYIRLIWSNLFSSKVSTENRPLFFSNWVTSEWRSLMNAQGMDKTIAVDVSYLSQSHWWRKERPPDNYAIEGWIFLTPGRVRRWIISGGILVIFVANKPGPSIKLSQMAEKTDCLTSFSPSF